MLCPADSPIAEQKDHREASLSKKDKGGDSQRLPRKRLHIPACFSAELAT